MYRVLLAGGDNRRAALALEAALGPDGHGSAAGILVAAVYADTCETAVAALAADQPDVLVVDVAMRQWRKVVPAARRRGTAYVLLLGASENLMADLAREVGANGYLAKPFSAGALEKQIRYWLAPRQSAPPGKEHGT